jgi:hypothetical protein
MYALSNHVILQYKIAINAIDEFSFGNPHAAVDLTRSFSAAQQNRRIEHPRNLSSVV